MFGEGGKEGWNKDVGGAGNGEWVLCYCFPFSLDDLVGTNGVSVIDLSIAASVCVEHCTLPRFFIFKLYDNIILTLYNKVKQISPNEPPRPRGGVEV